MLVRSSRLRSFRSRFRIWTLTLVAGLLLGTGAVSAPAAAQLAAEEGPSVPLRLAPPSVDARSVEAPPARVAESFGVAPLAEMAAARDGALDELRALAAHNRSGARPLQNGFSRPLPAPQRVRFDRAMARDAAGMHDGGAFLRFGGTTAVWGTEVRVEDAYRIRLHLDDVRLPENARLWVYGRDGTARGPFGRELVDDGALWTPSVAGPVIRLEVELPASALNGAGETPGFTVDRVLETVRLDAAGAPLPSEPTPFPAAQDTSCIEDLSCHDQNDFPVIDAASFGIAQLLFVQGGGQFACTGGLLNDVEATNTPWLLTANHCIASQSAASSLEATWDWRTASCDGPEPPRSGQVMSNGATLITTSPDTDHTLLRLNSIPPGRAFLGWNAATPTRDLPTDTKYHRIHHPAPEGILQPQRYTQFERIADDDILTCPLGEGDPQVNDPDVFIHTVQVLGGDFGGSSGAPLMLDNGQVVGQLFGACGPAPLEGCDDRNNNLDGAFYQAFNTDPVLEATLQNEDDPLPPGDLWLTTAEQPGFEFQVEITPPASPVVTGAKEDQCIVEALCVSGALAGRPEVFVKIIGPRPNGFLWVQISRFTPSQVEVWVRQVSTGEVNYYLLDPVDPASDDVSGLQDRDAFTP